MVNPNIADYNPARVNDIDELVPKRSHYTLNSHSGIQSLAHLSDLLQEITAHSRAFSASTLVMVMF